MFNIYLKNNIKMAKSEKGRELLFRSHSDAAGQ